MGAYSSTKEVPFPTPPDRWIETELSYLYPVSVPVFSTRSRCTSSSFTPNMTTINDTNLIGFARLGLQLILEKLEPVLMRHVVIQDV